MIATLRAILWGTFNGVVDNRLTSMAAAIAFYTLFSIGPLLILSVAIAEPLIGRMLAQETIVASIGEIVGADNLEILRRFAARDLFRGGGWAALLGLVVLLYSGSGVFVELDAALDVIWRPREGWKRHPVLAEVRTRLLALAMITLLGVLFLVVVLAGLGMSAYAGALAAFPVLGEWLGPAVSNVVHYGLITLFFSLIYKWLPDVRVPWRFALVSGAVVALMFAAGNRAIVLYFEATHMTSAFGAAGGIAAVMVWVYYTALMVLLGAQVGRATRDALDARPPAVVEGSDG